VVNGRVTNGVECRNDELSSCGRVRRGGEGTWKHGPGCQHWLDLLVVREDDDDDDAAAADADADEDDDEDEDDADDEDEDDTSDGPERATW